MSQLLLQLSLELNSEQPFSAQQGKLRGSISQSVGDPHGTPDTHHYCSSNVGLWCTVTAE